MSCVSQVSPTSILRLLSLPLIVPVLDAPWCTNGEEGTRTPEAFTLNSFQDCALGQPDPLLMPPTGATKQFQVGLEPTTQAYV